MAGTLRVGTSGWQYDHWKGDFYPGQLKKTEWFDHYAGQFDTVEVNNTFYHLPKAETFDRWARQSPEGFLYVLKYSRYGSHIKRLKDPADHVATYLDRARRLGEHLGPILVQLPPRWNADPPRLKAFLDAAPDDLRWAVEFRDESWLNEEIFSILADRNAALVIHDLIADHPRRVTADWVYLRYHGANQRYEGTYTPQKLSADARRVRQWLGDGLDVYAYFNNDVGGHAPRDAADLRRYVTESRG
jgi:uncharacterized protein YecE (DUF72 family)